MSVKLGHCQMQWKTLQNYRSLSLSSNKCFFSKNIYESLFLSLVSLTGVPGFLNIKILTSGCRLIWRKSRSYQEYSLRDGVMQMNGWPNIMCNTGLMRVWTGSITRTKQETTGSVIYENATKRKVQDFLFFKSHSRIHCCSVSWVNQIWHMILTPLC